jgi:hypothetical protein
VSWVGFQYCLDRGQVGLTPEKFCYFAQETIAILEIKNGRIPYKRCERYIHRWAWLGRILPYIKPFLKAGYTQLARVRRIREKQAEKSGRPIDTLLATSYVMKFKLESDLPYLVWTLANRARQIDITARERYGELFRADAYGDQDRGGIAGWSVAPGDCSQCSDLSKIKWFQCMFDRKLLGTIFGSSVVPQKIIAALEACAQLIGVVLYAPRGSEFVARTDSQVVAWIGESWKAKAPELRMVLRMIAWHVLERNLYPRLQHLPGIENIIADAISRNKEAVMNLLQEENGVLITLCEFFSQLELDEVQEEINVLREHSKKHA